MSLMVREGVDQISPPLAAKWFANKDSLPFVSPKKATPWDRTSNEMHPFLHSDLAP